MESEMARSSWATPDNGWVVAGAALAVALVTAVPMLLLGTALHIVLVAGALVSVVAILFSPRRALVALVVVISVLPATLIDATRLPLGLRPWELILLAALLFAVIDFIFLWASHWLSSPCWSAMSSRWL